MCVIPSVMSLTHVTVQEVKAGLDEDQRVPDQSGLGTVHVPGAVVQVLDHTGHATDPTLTEQPLSAAWKHNVRVKNQEVKRDVRERNQEVKRDVRERNQEVKNQEVKQDITERNQEVKHLRINRTNFSEFMSMFL